MSRRRGIFIADDGKSVSPNNLRYASDNPHLQASLIKDPLHMDIVTAAGGTALSFAAGVPATQTETIRTIKHNLPYTPEVLVYFYAYSYLGSTSHANAGKYYADIFLFSGSAGTVSDALYIEVDDTNVYFRHTLEDFGILNYTSDADDYQIRIKYYILSNDSHVTSYDTKPY